jgi:hypothetical protein
MTDVGASTTYDQASKILLALAQPGIN